MYHFEIISPLIAVFGGGYISLVILILSPMHV